MTCFHGLTGLAFGGDYNPEQWSEEVWKEDLRLMRKARVNLVTVGVFSWSALQPCEDRFEFDWLDRVLEMLWNHRIHVDLATATASPPPWLSHRYPGVLAVGNSGHPYIAGSRQHYSPCSADYRRFAAELVHRLADRYAQFPGLAAWHIGNEYMCHVRECHGVETQARFRAWLRNKYTTLETLNACWTTRFWSQVYTDWEEIHTPRSLPYLANPAQALDYRRFMNEMNRELFEAERAIVKAANPEIPVTTNFMGFFAPLDQWSWAQGLDFASWDAYPDPALNAGGEAIAAAGHDLTRSLKPNQPFVLMEHATSAVNWRPVNTGKAPGQMRLWSLQAIARGADGALFFQWRASRGGAEKFHSAMVPHVPAEKSRIFSEVCELGEELSRLSEVAGTAVRAEVAIVVDWENWWATQSDGKPMHLDLGAIVQQWHRLLFRQNVAVDFIRPTENLSPYKLLVVPGLYLLPAKSAATLESFVRCGGVLVASYFTGIVDEHEQVVLGGYPSLLRDVLGIWVEEWFPLAEKERLAVRWRSKRRPIQALRWSERVHLERAEALGIYLESAVAGCAVVTRNHFGRGRAYYFASDFSESVMCRLLKTVTADADVHPVWSVPRGVEATVRDRDGVQYLFLLNHTTRCQRVSTPSNPVRDLLTGEYVGPELHLAPLGAAVLQLEHSLGRPTPDPESALRTRSRSVAPI